MPASGGMPPATPTAPAAHATPGMNRVIRPARVKPTVWLPGGECVIRRPSFCAPRSDSRCGERGRRRGRHRARGLAFSSRSHRRPSCRPSPPISLFSAPPANPSIAGSRLACLPPTRPVFPAACRPPISRTSPCLCSLHVVILVGYPSGLAGLPATACLRARWPLRSNDSNSARCCRAGYKLP